MPDQVSKLIVALGVKGADARELDELTRNLRNELRQQDVRSVERIAQGEAPPGSKGDPFTLGWLAVTLSPIVANKVFDILVEWARRKHDRTVKVTIGQDTIELSGASGEERQKLLNKWMKEVGHGRSS